MSGFRMLKDHRLQEALGACLLSHIDMQVFLTQAIREVLSLFPMVAFFHGGREGVQNVLQGS